jgi:hypothetical protein
LRGKDEPVGEPVSEKGYETQFEFPLWTLIKERAERKDISYYAAAREVVPEYKKGIRYDDEEFEDSVIEKAMKEMAVEMEAFKALMGPSAKGGS